MESEDYISQVDGKFYIDRIFNEKKYNFGIFNTYEEALERLDYLEEEGWPISKDIVENGVVTDRLSLSLDNIEEVDGNFVIFKFVNSEKFIFGEFDSIEDAKEIRNNLIDNAWESTEPYTNSEYGKYIRNEHGKFVIRRVYNGKPFSKSFRSLDDALKYREYLVSTNWGDLNVPFPVKKTKYISYNGIMYTIQRSINGKVNVYGFFYDLEDAIKQRDWLISNNWSKLEVPDDSKKYIHKQGNKFLIYKKSDDDIEYFGIFPTFDEAKDMRNKLIMNDWNLNEKSEDIEKISDFIYFDGDFYIIKKEVDGQDRVYGVYKNKNQALHDEKILINHNWDDLYAISTEEYPYGENIIPFDYIFILEESTNGIKKELGKYYSFRDTIIAKNKKIMDIPNKINNDKFDNDVNKLTFSVKVGKSYKNRGWSIIRDTTYDLIPKLPYEDNCDIIVDGIRTSAKLNLLPRIFYTKPNDVVEHLENLAKTNPDRRINVELLLNKKSIFEESNNEINDLNVQLDIENDINELKTILENVNAENDLYVKKFNEINRIINKIGEINFSYHELSIYDSDLRIKLLNIIDLINSLNKVIKE